MILLTYWKSNNLEDGENWKDKKEHIYKKRIALSEKKPPLSRCRFLQHCDREDISRKIFDIEQNIPFPSLPSDSSISVTTSSPLVVMILTNINRAKSPSKPAGEMTKNHIYTAPTYLLLPLGKWGLKWGDFHWAMGCV